MHHYLLVPEVLIVDWPQPSPERQGHFYFQSFMNITIENSQY